MLAPMQGLTNRALRGIVSDMGRPDTLFTEFMRVNAAATTKRLSAVDRRDAVAVENGIPLVVQLIGHGVDPLVSAACEAQAAGAAHINLNLGCPYGRMGSGLTGGGILRSPDVLPQILPALRRVVTGSLSVKIRAGYDDPLQILGLLPLFEESGIDFLVLHPRTVVQEYTGTADHGITARVVSATRLPVIANGDIRSADQGLLLLKESCAAGLMLGRGAIADPLLFERLRGRAAASPGRDERAQELQRYLRAMLGAYGRLFCGDVQVLNKVKGILATMDDPDFERLRRKLKKATTLAAFNAVLDSLE